MTADKDKRIAQLESELTLLKSSLDEENPLKSYLDGEFRMQIEYLANHESKPSMYLGYRQPGASPTFYGPDEVVVDGDWLEMTLRQSKKYKASIQRFINEAIVRVISTVDDTQKRDEITKFLSTKLVVEEPEDPEETE